MKERCIDNDYNNYYPNYMPEGNLGCPQERVCTRVFVHEVPHMVPIHTRIINHHVYRHTYTPVYTTSECDTCENVYDPCPGSNQMYY